MGYFGWVGMSGGVWVFILGGWVNILDGWEWLGMSGGGGGKGGGGALFDNALLDLSKFIV